MSRSKITGLLAGTAAILAAAVAAAVVFVVMEDRNEPVAAPVTTVVTSTEAPPPPPETTTETQYVAPPPPAAPVGSAVVESSPCLESEIRTFGTDTSGRSLVCIYTGGSGPVWVRHGPNSGEVHNIGDPCSSPEDQVAVDPNGQAIMCGGSTWVAGP